MNKCKACGKDMKSTDKFVDICDDCWCYAEFLIDEDQDVECGACGYPHPKEHMIEGMCSSCFSVIVGE